MRGGDTFGLGYAVQVGGRGRSCGGRRPPAVVTRPVCARCREHPVRHARGLPPRDRLPVGPNSRRRPGDRVRTGAGRPAASTGGPQHFVQLKSHTCVPRSNQPRLQWSSPRRTAVRGSRTAVPPRPGARSLSSDTASEAPPSPLTRLNHAPAAAAEAALLRLLRQPPLGPPDGRPPPVPDRRGAAGRGGRGGVRPDPGRSRRGAGRRGAPRRCTDRGGLAAHTALRAAHAAYEARFGHAFVIGLDGTAADPAAALDQILASLRERLGHDEDEERVVAAEQLRRLCRARLRPADAAHTAASSGRAAFAGRPVHPTVRVRSHLAYPAVLGADNASLRWPGPVDRTRPGATDSPRSRHGPRPRSRRVFPCRLERCTAAGKECGPGWLIESPASSSSSSCSSTSSTPLSCVSPPRTTTRSSRPTRPRSSALLEYGLVAAILFHALNGLRDHRRRLLVQGPALPEADALDRRRPVARADARRDLPRPRPRRSRTVRELSDRCPLTSTARRRARPRRGRRLVQRRQPGAASSSRRASAPGRPRSRTRGNFEMDALAVHAPVRRRPGRPGPRPPADPAGAGRRCHQDRLRLRGRPLGLPVLAGLGPGDAVARDAARRATACAPSSTTTRSAPTPALWLKGLLYTATVFTILLGTLVIFTFDPNIR